MRCVVYEREGDCSRADQDKLLAGILVGKETRSLVSLKWFYAERFWPGNTFLLLYFS